jgi:tol-pal system protein YbgF
MKKILRNLLIVLAISPFLAQCASQDEINRLNYQLRVVNKKVDDMKTDTMSDMQKRQAASSDQIDQLQSEIQNLRGQLEETAHMNRMLTEQNKELESSFKSFSTKSAEEREAILKQNQEQDKVRETKLAELSEKLAALQASKLKEAERRAREASRRAEEARAKANAAGYNLHRAETTTHITADKKKSVVSEGTRTAAKAEKKVQPPAASQTKPKSAETASSAGNDKFNLAMTDYKKGNYAGAFKQFESFIGNNETGEKSIEARYMMGECLFKQKDYDQAILQYQKIVSNFPQNPKAPAALLRQGMAFESLSDKETAKIIYKKILTQYSNSPEAATAKKRAGSL